MRKLSDGIFRQYGVTMSLTSGDTVKQVRGFFQPVRSKSWQSLVNAAIPLGEIPRGQYVYIGPVDPAAKAGNSLKVGSQNYQFRRTELIYDANGPVYCWGMCVEKGGEDTWGQS